MPAPPILTFRDFDAAVVIQMNPEEISVPDGSRPRGQRKVYAVRIADVEGHPTYGGCIPINVIPASIAYVPDIMPSIVVRPGDPDIALDRWQNGAKYRWTTIGAAEVTVVNSHGESVTGFNSVTERESPAALDIQYEVQLYAASRNTVLRMLTFLLTHFQPRGGLVTVTKKQDDGSTVEHTFDAFVETIAHLSEIASIAEGVHSYSVPIRVEAYVDLPAGDTVKRQFTGGIVGGTDGIDFEIL